MERKQLLTLYPIDAPRSSTTSKAKTSSPKKDSIVLILIKDKHVLPGRDDHVLLALLDEESFLLLDGCLEHIPFLPEWFLARCLSLTSTSQQASQEVQNTFRLHLLHRSFDHGKLVGELRRLPFETVLAMAKLVLKELEERLESYSSLEIFAWASALVESHFTEWTLAEDSHQTLFRLNELLSDQIESMFLWQDVQGRIKGLMAASKTAEAAVKEDVTYWHSLIEF